MGKYINPKTQAALDAMLVEIREIVIDMLASEDQEVAFSQFTFPAEPTDLFQPVFRIKIMQMGQFNDDSPGEEVE